MSNWKRGTRLREVPTKMANKKIRQNDDIAGGSREKPIPVKFFPKNYVKSSSEDVRKEAILPSKSQKIFNISPPSSLEPHQIEWNHGPIAWNMERRLAREKNYVKSIVDVHKLVRDRKARINRHLGEPSSSSRSPIRSTVIFTTKITWNSDPSVRETSSLSPRNLQKKNPNPKPILINPNTNEKFRENVNLIVWSTRRSSDSGLFPMVNVSSIWFEFL